MSHRTAGLGSSCNHITTFLFRVESFVVTGKVKPSHTSQLCKWNVPSGTKVDITPLPAQEMMFQNQHYVRVNEHDLQKDKESYMKFSTTLHSPQNAAVSDAKNLWGKFYMAIKDDIKSSRLGELIEKKPLSRTNAHEFNLPKSVSAVQKEFVYNNKFSISANVTEFINLLMQTDDQIRDLAKFTESQAKCQEWDIHRQGRITASVFHRVCTRVNTLRKKPDEVTDYLFETIIWVNGAPPTKAIKHGRALEPYAKRKYVHELKRTHLNLNFKDIGLVLFMQYPYLGTSSDLIGECTCCSKSVVEIKCPSSIAGEKPSYKN